MGLKTPADKLDGIHLPEDARIPLCRHWLRSPRARVAFRMSRRASAGWRVGDFEMLGSWLHAAVPTVSVPTVGRAYLGPYLPWLVPTLAKYDSFHYSIMPTLAQYDSFHSRIVPTLAKCSTLG